MTQLRWLKHFPPSFSLNSIIANKRVNLGKLSALKGPFQVKASPEDFIPVNHTVIMTLKASQDIGAQ